MANDPTASAGSHRRSYAIALSSVAMLIGCVFVFVSFLAYWFYEIHVGTVTIEVQRYGTAGDFRIDFLEDKTCLLRRVTGQIIIISRGDIEGLVFAVPKESSIGVIVLQYEDGTVDFSRSPAFQELWNHRDDLLNHARSRVGDCRDDPELLQRYLRSLDRDSLDPPLEKFIRSME